MNIYHRSLQEIEQFIDLILADRREAPRLYCDSNQRGFGFPRYKKYGKYQSFLFPQFKDNPIQGNTIKLPKIGEIAINCHRPIPEGFKVKGVRIVTRARGTIWYAVVTIQYAINIPNPLPFGRGIGIDIGLESFLVTSDNFRVEPVLVFQELQSRLKVLQRRASRKTKRSKKLGESTA